MKSIIHTSTFARCALFSVVFVPIAVFADDQNQGAAASDSREYSVTASRLDTPLEKLGSSVTVISSKEIEASQKKQVLDILEGVPGVDVVRSGGSGGNTTVFMRGANSEHTLVLIDGIEANNPISTARSFNFADIALDNVERIEIIRGPQSTLYGSDALGGVINIITKRGGGKPAASISTEAGSYSTIIEKASASGSSGPVRYSIGASREDSDSISAAGASYGNSEHDAYQNTSVAARAGIDPIEELSGDLIFRYNSARSDIDNFGGFGGDDPNRLLKNEQLFSRAEARTALLDDKLEQRFGVSYSDQDLDDDNDPDADHPLDRQRSNYQGSLLKFDLQNDIKIDESNTVVLGLETEREEADSFLDSDSEFGPFSSQFDERDARTNAIYLQEQFVSTDRFATTAGARMDDHTKFGSEFTWRIAPTLSVDETGSRVKGSYGTGFKAPSLYQLYSEYGDQNLEAEESDGWDIGVEQKVYRESVIVGVTYFKNDFDNLISFDPNTFVFENIAEASTSGFETTLDVILQDNLKVKGSYTYTDTEDETTGTSLLRRPRNKFAISTAYDPTEDFHLQLTATFVGDRFDNDFSTFPATTVKLGSYTLIDMAGSYDITENFAFFMQAENIGDEDYEEVLGFGTPGAAVYAGIRAKI